jgi:hypothetical protein
MEKYGGLTGLLIACFPEYSDFIAKIQRQVNHNSYQ